MKNHIILALLFFCFLTSSYSQTSFGFRTGLNLNTIAGETEEGQEYGNNTGFHIGVAFNRNFTDIWGVRVELLYNQKGGINSYDSQSTILLRDRNDRGITHIGNADIGLTVNNIYIDLPISGYAKVTNWLEISAGIVPGFLASSRGRGDLEFNSDALSETFNVTLDYNYFGDDPLQVSSDATELITVREVATARDLTIPNAIGALFLQEERNGSLYNRFNLDAIFGLNFYVNSGLYIGGKIQYGLTDLTQTSADFSLVDNTTTRDDNDVNLVIQASVGFNF